MSVKPADTIKVGRIKATIWENVTNEGKTYFSLNMTRTYRTEAGDWKDTTTFSLDDLPRIRLASDKAFDRITELTEQKTIQKAEEETEPETKSAPATKKRGSRKSFTEKVEAEREGQSSKSK